MKAFVYKVYARHILIRCTTNFLVISICKSIFYIFKESICNTRYEYTLKLNLLRGCAEISAAHIANVFPGLGSLRIRKITT